MSQFSIGTNVGGVERQFTYHEVEPITMGAPLDEDYVPPIHRDIFQSIVESFKMPESQREPWAPKGQKGWVLADPISELIPESSIPLGPGIYPSTRQRRMVRNPTGTQGIATHVNLLIDVSGSMGNNGGGEYGYVDGYPMGGEDVARIAAACMVEACRMNGDSFAIFTFGRSAANIIRPACRDYDDVINWILGPELAGSGNQPFAGTEGSTNLQHGIRLVNEEMDRVRNQIKGAITIVICDGYPNGGDLCGNQRDHLFFNDCDQAKYGVAQGPSPGEAFSIARDDNYHRDNYGPVLYIWVAGAGGNPDLVAQWNEIIRENNPGRNCSNCVLDFIVNGGSGANAFGGAIMDIASGTGGNSSILSNCE